MIALPSILTILIMELPKYIGILYVSGGLADNIAGEHSLGGNILSVENLHQQGDCCNAHKFYAVVHSGNLRGAANGEEGGRNM